MAFIVTPSELNRRAELYHQLGSMISAGVPLIKSLEMVSANPSVRIPRRILFALIDCLKQGMTFTQSMQTVQGWLSDFDVALLSTGEKSGRLDATFKLLAVYYSTRAKIIRDTITGLLTTMVTLHVFLLVFPIGLLTEFAQGIVSNDYSRCWPFISEKILAFGALYGVGLFFIFASQGRRGEKWRVLVETIFRRIPILRLAQKYLVLSRLAAALEALINAGISIVISWDLSAAACGSPFLRKQILKWKPALETGSTPGELIHQTKHFPDVFANLYNTGEQSGKLDESLLRLQAYYQDEGFRLMRLFTWVLNGVIYGAIVLLVAFNVISFWTHYYGNMINSF